METTQTRCRLPEFAEYVGTYSAGCAPLTPPAIHHGGRVRSHFGVRIAQPDGYRAVTIDLHLPVSPAGPVRPIVFASGGGFRINNTLTGPWIDLVTAGFAVACVTYRLSAEASHPDPASDIKAAVRWLRAHGDQLGIATEKVGALGLSAGGYLVSYAALNPGTTPQDEALACHPEASGRINAVAAYYPPSDFLHLEKDNATGAMETPGVPGSSEVRYLGFIPSESPERNGESSLLEMISDGAPPFFLAHGTADHRVHADQSERFAAALERHGRLAHFERVPGADHAGPEFSSRELTTQVARFLSHALK